MSYLAPPLIHGLVTHRSGPQDCIIAGDLYGNIDRFEMRPQGTPTIPRPDPRPSVSFWVCSPESRRRLGLKPVLGVATSACWPSERRRHRTSLVFEVGSAIMDRSK